jgi:ABC-type multidrug transport system ATPase subunit
MRLPRVRLGRHGDRARRQPGRERGRAAPDGVHPGGPGLPGLPGQAPAADGALFYPDWSQELADSLIEDFRLPLKRKVRRLSRGMRSAVGIVIGLAARAEVTLFDEPYAGLDPVARQLFYDRLLADYAEHPRTILLSTHLIDEVAGLLERAMVIDRGAIVLDAATDDLRGAATSVSGRAISVAEFTAENLARRGPLSADQPERLRDPALARPDARPADRRGDLHRNPGSQRHA